ncbi:MAG: fumarylacetoacetate hydrolase family protein [Sandarakinorhabdus sp.]|nr:fumarylacetoacetate hydrolase family protein [Sandarakinorhabdus sp.]
MKLLRWGTKGAERPGLVDAQGRRRDLTGHIDDIGGPSLGPAGLNALRRLDENILPFVPEGARIGACVGGVGKFICIGLNFADHARETGVEPPVEPVVFMKATSAISGPDDDIVLPRNSGKSDWEVELGVVIGAAGKYIAEADAMIHVAGYCVINDLSERAFQLEGTGQWVKGKSCDGFGPIGPWLVTADEIADPHDLGMTLSVNGHRYQNGSTRTMIFRIPFLIHYLSHFMSLHPGDIISTGTPPGVGLGQKPPVYLQAGDLIELAIDGLGRQRQHVLASES